MSTDSPEILSPSSSSAITASHTGAEVSGPLSPAQEHTNVLERSTPVSCPVGEPHCAVINELYALRSSVAELMVAASTDNLTGLYNHRYLVRALGHEMERSRRCQLPTALIMMDLDYFKALNDQWGHEMGNRALQHMGKLLKDSTRQLDICCRYGGEEFAVVLPSTDMLTAIQVAERIRQSLVDNPLIHTQADQGFPDEQPIALTVSLGVDTYVAPGQETPEQFIDRVDRSLYRAKKEGRNRVCHGNSPGRSEAAVSKEERHMLSSLFGEAS